jgi:hypothetical protein
MITPSLLAKNHFALEYQKNGNKKIGRNHTPLPLSAVARVDHGNSV